MSSARLPSTVPAAAPASARSAVVSQIETILSLASDSVQRHVFQTVIVSKRQFNLMLLGPLNNGRDGVFGHLRQNSDSLIYHVTEAVSKRSNQNYENEHRQPTTAVFNKIELRQGQVSEQCRDERKSQVEHPDQYQNDRHQSI